MPLAITEDHRALAEVAAAMVAGRAGTVGARRILLDREKSGAWWSTDGLWKEMVSTGWLGLHIDERFGGQGYGLPELTIVLEQLGRAAVGGPFLPTVAVSAVISEVGTDEQRERWLPRLVSGDVVAGIGTNSDVAVRDSTSQRLRCPPWPKRPPTFSCFLPATTSSWCRPVTGSASEPLTQWISCSHR